MTWNHLNNMRKHLSLSIDVQCELPDLLFRCPNSGLTLPLFAQHISVHSVYCLCYATQLPDAAATRSRWWYCDCLRRWHTTAFLVRSLCLSHCSVSCQMSWIGLPVVWPQHSPHLTLLGTNLWEFVAVVVYSHVWCAAVCDRDSKEGGFMCGVENVGSIRILFECVQGYHRCFSCAVLFTKTCWYPLLDSSKAEDAPFCIENYMSLQLSVVK